jgi:hypothetical protein
MAGAFSQIEPSIRDFKQTHLGVYISGLRRDAEALAAKRLYTSLLLISGGIPAFAKALRRATTIAFELFQANFGILCSSAE